MVTPPREEGEKGRGLDLSPPRRGGQTGSPTLKCAALAASIVVLAGLGYYLCPGHLYLYHDTLIYVPMLEHLFDPTVLAKDFLASRPHLAFTLYDEIALGLRRLTGLGFREVLTFQQWTFRAIGIFGVYLVARALKLSERLSLLVAAAFALGATTVGAALSSLEFEPVPRSFAFPLILLALGLTAHGRYLAAGCAGALGFLYHPPIGYPFWTVYAARTLWPSQRPSTRSRLLGLLPLVFAGALLFVFSRPQAALSPPEPFFRRLDPFQEVLQRAFDSYNWISLWPWRWVEHHLVLGVFAAVAYWRLRRRVDDDLRFFLLGLPLVGILSMPLSYLLLEKLEWSLLPQFQPMRALVYLAVVTGILTGAAGIQAVERDRYLEGVLWLAVAYAIPTEPRVLHLLAPRWSSLAFPLVRRRETIVVALALLASLAVRSETRRRAGAGLLVGASLLVPFLLLPYGAVNRFPPRDNPEIYHLAEWARASTPNDAVFLFPDAGEDSDPNVFRATALRAVYIDWRSNGQVNFFRDFAQLWWSRWWNTMARRFEPRSLEGYRALGIDYVVLRPANRLPRETPVFENSRFVAYALGRSK